MSLEHLDTGLGFAVIMLLLSLLITVLVQAIIAVLGLRGSNLRWGVAQVLTQIDPAIARHAQEIAERALQHSAISPVWKRSATAIRADELTRVLDQVIKSDEPWHDPQAKVALKRLLDDVLPGNAELTDKGEALAAQLATLVPAQAAAVRGVVVGALGATRKIVAGVSTWFDTIMDRTTERFVVQARWVTAAAAFVFALALQVDSLQLLQRLSTDSEFRNRVVSASQSVLQRAEDVVVLTERKPLASQALKEARDSVGLETRAAAGDIPPNLVTREQGEVWLRTRVQNVKRLDSLLDVYNRRFDEATRVWVGELRASTGAITEQLRSATFQLVPNPYPGLDEYLKEPRHLVGTLMTALLLTLGAPFWFNVLRQLANLRPAIAGKVDAGKVDKEKAAT